MTSSDSSTYLIRVRDEQDKVEVFFHPSNACTAIASSNATVTRLHEKYCLRKTEPDEECLCTQSYGQTSCELHNYLKNVEEHDARNCPFKAKVIIEAISPDGVKPLPL